MRFISSALTLTAVLASACADGRRQAEQAKRDDADCPRRPSDSFFLQGERMYARTCATCHKLSGDGQRGAFPPLRHHAGKLGSTAAGRRYLARLLIWGQRGTLVAEGDTYTNIMPPQAPGIADEDLAAVLSYVTYTFGNCRQTHGQPAFTAAEIRHARAEQKSEGLKKMKEDRAQALGRH